MTADLAHRLLPLLDLTSLNDGRDDDIAALCAKAVAPEGAVAAVCSWPGFTADMKQRLTGTGVKVAVVINFPEGTATTEAAVAETRAALAAGADELDLVVPYRAWIEGLREEAIALVAAVRAAGETACLKVILETGAFSDPEDLAQAARATIRAGADFLKTSTGKIPVGATPAAAESLLAAIRETGGTVGFKASGGIRSLEDAETYLTLADRMLGEDWVAPDRFRIGASRLLDAVLAELRRDP